MGKSLCGTTGQTLPEGFHRPSYMIDEPGSGPHQFISGFNNRQVRLSGFAPMLNRIQQLGIHSSQTSQKLSIFAVRFLSVLADESNLSGIGHDFLVSLLLGYRLHPPRVGSRFQHHPHFG